MQSKRARSSLCSQHTIIRLQSLVDSAGINAILVGDSLGMVVLGYEDTLSVTMEDMIHHSAAVSRGMKEYSSYHRYAFYVISDICL